MHINFQNWNFPLAEAHQSGRRSQKSCEKLLVFPLKFWHCACTACKSVCVRANQYAGGRQQGGSARPGPKGCSENLMPGAAAAGWKIDARVQVSSGAVVCSAPAPLSRQKNKLRAAPCCCCSPARSAQRAAGLSGVLDQWWKQRELKKEPRFVVGMAAAFNDHVTCSSLPAPSLLPRLYDIILIIKRRHTLLFDCAAAACMWRLLMRRARTKMRLNFAHA